MRCENWLPAFVLTGRASSSQGNNNGRQPNILPAPARCCRHWKVTDVASTTSRPPPAPVSEDKPKCTFRLLALSFSADSCSASRRRSSSDLFRYFQGSDATAGAVQRFSSRSQTFFNFPKAYLSAVNVKKATGAVEKWLGPTCPGLLTSNQSKPPAYYEDVKVFYYYYFTKHRAGSLGYMLQNWMKRGEPGVVACLLLWQNVTLNVVPEGSLLSSITFDSGLRSI